MKYTNSCISPHLAIVRLPFVAGRNRAEAAPKSCFLHILGTFCSYIVMMVLWERRSLTVNELGQQLYLDSGTLTPLLKSMEMSGLVKRERSLDDERTIIVSMTEKGEELKEKAAAIPAKIGNCISLCQAESETLYALLYKLIGNLDK